MINTVIFDLDGTLVDSLIDLGQTVNLLLKKRGYPEHPIDEYRQFVGNGVVKLIERALPSQHRDEVMELKEEFDQLYQENCLNNTLPYPGIVMLVDKLYELDYNLAIVTNKPQVHAVKIVKALFPGRFKYIFGSTGKQPRKPDPCLTNMTITLFDVKKDNVIYVGDSDVDIETAKNTKVKSIGVSWGFRGAQELKDSGANYVVNQVDEILEIINDWNK